MVEDLTLRGVSVGYRVQRWMYFTEDGEHNGRGYAAGTWLAARWQALEASFTPRSSLPWRRVVNS